MTSADLDRVYQVRATIEQKTELRTLFDTWWAAHVGRYGHGERRVAWDAFQAAAFILADVGEPIAEPEPVSPSSPAVAEAVLEFPALDHPGFVETEPGQL
jgi:hypothetical protein